MGSNINISQRFYEEACHLKYVLLSEGHFKRRICVFPLFLQTYHHQLFFSSFSSPSDFIKLLDSVWASLIAQWVNNLPAMQKARVQSLGLEDPLEMEMATHTSILAWKIPQRSLVGCSPWGHRESDMTEQLTLTDHVVNIH